MAIFGSMRLVHANGTASVAGDKITLTDLRGPGNKGFRIIIKNLEPLLGNNLEISFNGGRTYFPIAPQATFAEDANFHYFVVRGIAAPVAYTALVAVG